MKASEQVHFIVLLEQLSEDSMLCGDGYLFCSLTIFVNRDKVLFSSPLGCICPTKGFRALHIPCDKEK